MTAKQMIGTLESVPIREVWADEAHDLTPWLAENTDRLSEALGMDFELEGTEVSVGPFRADIMLRDVNTGSRVVVENMLNETDHDHLGKVITYAAGLEATYAVLIAEKFRPEHRSALQWLNAHSTESAGFFGITLKVWRIGDSAYAPQLDVVVEPDGWVREVRAASTDALSDVELHNRDFWSEFLPEFHEAHPGWSRARIPQKVNWMWFPAGRTGVQYSVSFCRPDKRYQFRIELYIDTGDTEGTARIFNVLAERRNEIERIFGEPLEWEPLGERRASRIASYYRDDVRVREREKWPSLREWAIERMGIFRKALQPHLDALDQLGDSGLKPRTGKMKAVTPGEKPAPNSYWVVPNRLAAGEYPSAKPSRHQEAVEKVTTLLGAGIDHFIDLTEVEEGLNPYVDLANREASHRGVTTDYEQRSIPDVSVPNTPEDMVAILDAIDAALDGGKTVYVHCWGGVGRTGTVIGCWLVRHGSTASEALAQVAGGWQGMEKFNPEIESPETSRQREYVRNWPEAGIGRKPKHSSSY